MTMFGFLTVWSSTVFKVWKEDGPVPFFSTEVTVLSILIDDEVTKEEEDDGDREPKVDFVAEMLDAHLIRDVEYTLCKLYIEQFDNIMCERGQGRRSNVVAFFWRI